MNDNNQIIIYQSEDGQIGAGSGAYPPASGHHRHDGTKRLADNTLVALTLMIAESRTEEKDVMVKVVVNLINQRNE